MSLARWSPTPTSRWRCELPAPGRTLSRAMWFRATARWASGWPSASRTWHGTTSRRRSDNETSSRRRCRGVGLVHEGEPQSPSKPLNRYPHRGAREVPCPACGSDEWEVVTAAKEGTGHTRNTHWGHGSSGPGKAFVCRACGHEEQIDSVIRLRQGRLLGHGAGALALCSLCRKKQRGRPGWPLPGSPCQGCRRTGRNPLRGASNYRCGEIAVG